MPFFFMKYLLRVTLLCLFIFILMNACKPSSPKADLLIQNANIYTVSESQPKAEAVAIIGDTIAFVGSNQEAAAWADDHTQLLDLQGKTMTPGWIEGHAHFMGIGENKMNLDLLQVRSYEEMVRQVAEAVRKMKPGEWIVGRGWHQDKWDSLPDPMVKGFPTHQGLSAVAPQNPVYLSHASGHAALANAKAMEMAGIRNISPEAPAPASVEGGEIVKDPLGNPTGIFNENAMALIRSHIPEQSDERNEQVAQLAMQECLENGITSLHDAGESEDIIALYKKLAANGQLKTRLYVMLSSQDTSLLESYFNNGPEIGLHHHFLTIRSIKLYADGALGSRGAWLLNEYADMPGEYGDETTPVERIFEVTLKALQSGLQVCTHAIGDRANREVLDQYEKAFQQVPDRAENTRFRIEHAQHLSAQDIPRFAQLGVIPAMQAIHMSSDRPWAIDRLGQARIEEGAYVWRKLLDSGAIVVNGTDAPVEPINPIASFYASVTRKTLQGTPEGGYEASQKMTREEALRSYTLFPAFSAFEEEIKGTIAPGKLADFTVFSQDLMQVPEAQLLNTRVDLTIVGGKIVYERKP